MILSCQLVAQIGPGAQYHPPLKSTVVDNNDSMRSKIHEKLLSRFTGESCKFRYCCSIHNDSVLAKLFVMNLPALQAHPKSKLGILGCFLMFEHKYHTFLYSKASFPSAHSLFYTQENNLEMCIICSIMLALSHSQPDWLTFSFLSFILTFSICSLYWCINSSFFLSFL